MENKKICLRCGHVACPSCNDWCDVILYSSKDKGYHNGITDENEYPMPCCDTECIYDPNDTRLKTKTE